MPFPTWSAAVRVSGDVTVPARASAICDAQHHAPQTSVFSIRLIEPTDALPYADILERTSEEDRYCRFFHVVNHFDLRDIRRFVESRDDTIGFIAEDGTMPLGVAHAFLLADAMAEVALVVAADARHHGIGHALLERIITTLRERGCETACAVSLAANGAFAHLAQSMGMEPAGAGETTNWTLQITPRQL